MVEPVQGGYVSRKFRFTIHKSRSTLYHCTLMNPALRARAIAEWRGLPEKYLRPDRWQAPVDVLPKLMQRLGLKERLHETEVMEAWAKIVGEFISAHSAPVALREGTLYVRVLQPALHYELEQVSKIDILRKLKQRFGGKVIRDIRFRVG
jgi:predicted nucleic acid-binding Zn ribbon protein